ncbi:type II toxin-antitoxin system RelE/ParE family toxin [Agriterribacter humi]|jgi:plasmid stabilization system protein ParE|uniref:type II toxin-antitoxin system RelE/ParE family toxin n=1 Tax=Agriterribacter humi TaxID=1104781 RepID=UPI0012645630|nr:type II toxin-antitoxin system RelE/ParE family toxin [Agriterribacter humi]
MAYKYSFDPIAANEYEKAFDWYEEKSSIAADGLIVAVQDAITAICANPNRYRNTYKNLHEIALKKYPYNLVYYIDESRKLITITSLYHHKRDPKGKYKKRKSGKK